MSTSNAAASSALRELVTPFSVEITPREAATLPPLAGVLTPGTAVSITFLPRTPWEDTLAAARWIAEAGMRPVSHPGRPRGARPRGPAPDAVRPRRRRGVRRAARRGVDGTGR